MTSRPMVPALVVFVLFAHQASAATVAGRVADPDGRPVAAAHVIVAGSIGTVAEGRTDVNGSFSLDTIAAGAYEVRVFADGFQADPIAITVAAEDTRNLDVTLRISALVESIVDRKSVV